MYTAEIILLAFFLYCYQILLINRPENILVIWFFMDVYDFVKKSKLVVYFSF